MANHTTPPAQAGGREPLPHGARSPTGAAHTPSAAGAQTSLQEVLPQIKDLAQRVGGLRKLAEIIANLEESKE
jgi:hypothetical protein